MWALQPQTPLPLPLRAIDTAEIVLGAGETCVLATQRPRDIPQDVMSQLGTLFIHQPEYPPDSRGPEFRSFWRWLGVIARLQSLTLLC